MSINDVTLQRWDGPSCVTSLMATFVSHFVKLSSHVNIFFVTFCFAFKCHLKFLVLSILILGNLFFVFYVGE